MDNLKIYFYVHEHTQHTTHTHSSTNTYLRLEILHDVQKLIINLGLLTELNLHLIEVQEGVSDRKGLCVCVCVCMCVYVAELR